MTDKLLPPPKTYYVYKTTATDSDKYYIGVSHVKKANATVNDCKTHNYFGSGGKHHENWLKKHEEKLQKEIVGIFDNLEEARLLEIEEIDKVLGKDINCLNKQRGGNLNIYHNAFCKKCEQQTLFIKNSCCNCANTERKLTLEEFVNKAKEIHGDRYDYSKTEYSTWKKKLSIICKKHGYFQQTPTAHLRGSGCRICAIEKNKLSTEEFLRQAENIHGNKYGYSLVIYKTAHTKINIICKNHGSFWQTPANHLSGKDCTKCGDAKISKIKSLGIQEWVKRATKVHNGEYDYSLVTEYVNQKTKVKILCRIHGMFQQNAGSHLVGIGCPKCSKKIQVGYAREKRIKQLIEAVNELFQGQYDLPNINDSYVNGGVAVTVCCSEHGNFKQTPSKLKSGRGCKTCKKNAKN